MPYANVWNELTPTSSTLANTIATYFTSNMMAIRERLDDVFGTSGGTSINTADPYNIAYIRIQAVTDGGVIGGSGSFNVFNSANNAVNLKITDSGNAVLRSGNISTLAGAITFQSTDLSRNNVVINDNGSVTIANGLEIKAGTGIVDQFDAGTHSGALNVDLFVGNNQKLIVNGATTITLINGVAGGVYLLRIHYSGTPTLAFANLNWDNGNTVPVFTDTAGASDIITIYYDGTNYYGVAAGLNFSV